MTEFLEIDEKRQKIKSLNLDDLSIQDLKEYIKELNEELDRVNKEIKKKNNFKKNAENYFC